MGRNIGEEYIYWLSKHLQGVDCLKGRPELCPEYRPMIRVAEDTGSIITVCACSVRHPLFRLADSIRRKREEGAAVPTLIRLNRTSVESNVIEDMIYCADGRLIEEIARRTAQGIKEFFKRL